MPEINFVSLFSINNTDALYDQIKNKNLISHIDPIYDIAQTKSLKVALCGSADSQEKYELGKVSKNTHLVVFARELTAPHYTSFRKIHEMADLQTSIFSVFKPFVGDTIEIFQSSAYSSSVRSLTYNELDKLMKEGGHSNIDDLMENYFSAPPIFKHLVINASKNIYPQGHH